MMITDWIDTFIAQLAETAVSPHHTFNPYDHTNPYNAYRRQNLRGALLQAAGNHSGIMLVGEAPGYRGCRLTGIPFISPALLPPYATAVPEWPHIHNEASATIMQTTLATCQKRPFLWNAYPFHPHQPQNPQSNRPPTHAELAVGRPFLHLLQTHLKLHTIIAVGNKAAAALEKAQIPYQLVRHPSHGGQTAFRTGLQRLGLISL